MPEPTLTITDSEAAGLLVDSEKIQYLLPFMPCARSLTEAAHRLGVSVPHLRYHVQRFLKLGLLEVSERQARRGRPVVRYQATARRFFVPFTATPYENFEAMVLVKDLAWQAHISKAWTRLRMGQLSFERGGVRFSSDHLGRLTTEYVSGAEALPLSKVRDPADTTPAHWSTWSTVRLTEQDALELEKELLDLWQRYVQRSGEGQYLLRLALSPFVFDHSALKKEE